MRVFTLFKRFFPLLGRARWLVIPTICLHLVSTCADLVSIALFSYIVDNALGNGDLGALPGPAITWIAVALVGGLAGAGGTWLGATISERLILRLRNRLYEHIYRMPRTSRNNLEPGDLIARHTSDVESVEHLVSSGLVTGIVAVISTVVFAGAAIAIRAEPAVAALVLIPVVGLILQRLHGPLRSASTTERAINGQLNAEVAEGLSNADVIIADNQALRHQNRLDTLGIRWRRSRMTALLYTEAFGQAAKFIELLCLLAILGLGVWEIAHHRLSTGGLIAMTGYIGYLYPQIRSIGDLTMSMTVVSAAGQRITEILDIPVHHDPPIRPPATATPGPAGVELIDVHVSYPGSRRAVLRGLNLSVRPGELVAITGPSGAGKSTLASVLTAFIDPEEGTIRIGGNNIADMSAEQIRDRVGLLPQRAAIFSESVADNIRHGRPDADLDEVVDAAKAAGAHTFITELARGYDTPLGSYGTALSGGQQQRIALARALTRDTSVLVLDEPTTGLDPTTVNALMTDIRTGVHSRTTILITHDRDVARFADRVLCLEDGIVRETVVTSM